MSAQQVTEKAALSKAQEFFTRSDVVSRRAARKAPQLTLATNRDEFYVFNDEANGGYVVVSGEERMLDILMFAEDGSYNEKEMPCNMKAWLDDYARQVSYLRTHPEAKSSRRARANKANIDNLLDCWFGQRDPYNDKCPRHCVTGCIATAMAQIMYCHKWPDQTLETIPAYTTATLNISVPEIPVTTIDWANILKGYNYDDTYDTTQADAVATLMKLCGSSVEMDYTTTGSAASSYAASIAFKKYFGYDDLIEQVVRSNFNTDEWEQLVYDELNAKRPVLYSGFSETGGGHAFVLDGYKDGFFHVNWGWGGSESYVMMTGEGNWEGYTIGQSALINIQPDNGEYASRYAVVEGEKMTVYYDNKRSQRSGTVLPHKEDWQNYNITEIVIDPSFAKLNLRSLAYFFDNMEQLQKIEGIENLNTNHVTDMYAMFAGCSSLTSLDVSGFNTSNVARMSWMFYNCSSLTSLDVSGFNTSNVTDISGMFGNCSSLTSLDVSGFNTSNVTDMSWMFGYCSSLTSLDVSGFKTSNVTDMSRMFYDCSSLTSLDVSGFNTSNVTDMSWMFGYCSSLTSLDVSDFNTSNVTDMSEMFGGCSNLTSLDVSGFKTDKVMNMSEMFGGCSNLTSLDVSGFKTDKVMNMVEMFGYCSSLTSLDVSGFNTSNVTDMSSMFGYCSNLTTIYASERWDMSKVEATDDMFYNCEKLVGGAGTAYTWDFINGEYARIDKGPSAPGYFTYKALPYIPGDVNGDGLVNVTDIVVTVNYIMEKPSPDFNKEAADLNGDGVVNVTDIVMMVKIIMEASAREIAE
jgi:surface protein